MADQSSDEVRQVLESLDDADITRHGFTPYMRDYEIVAGNWTGDHSEVWRWIFTHCVRAEVTTAFSPETYIASWDDIRIQSPPDDDSFASGFVWAVGWAAAYPGARYIGESAEAASSSARLGHRMHEVVIETNVYNLRLVFHRVMAEIASTQGS